MTFGRTDVVVLFGGRSAEHEVACRSARFVLRHLDQNLFRRHAIGIDQEGRWWAQDVERLLTDGSGGLTIQTPSSGPILRGTFPGAGDQPVIFPVLHGTFGEDGTMQGLFEQADVAFVGPDTLGSAIGMDKIVSKRLAQIAGVPVVPWVDLRAQAWAQSGAAFCAHAIKQFGFPLFVKPARLGSSVGVSKVTATADLEAACGRALAVDDRIMIEKGMSVREIEVACLGDYVPQVSVPGEVIAHGEFYSYDAKYLDAKGASIEVPARLTADQAQEAQALANKVFVALELYGMARVDLFLERVTNKFYFNEVNTIPGFTEISQYPQLWAASGVGSADLLSRLVALAQQRLVTRLALSRRR